MSLEDKSPIVQSSNEFAFKLYKKLTKNTKKNLFFSPFSISTAIGMLYTGAKGETARQIEEAMNYSLRKRRLQTAFENFIKNFKEERLRNNTDFSLANAIWVGKEFALLETFSYVIETNYSALVSKVDFGNRSETKEKINSWVAKETKEKITELVDRINGSEELVITNAIYFRDTWLDVFDKDKTEQLPFFVTPEKKVIVDMMVKKKKKYHFASLPKYLVLRLPYKDRDLSLAIFLPKKADGLAEVEKELNLSKMDLAFRKLSTQEVDVFIPRFTISDALSLGKALQSLGIRDAFEEGKADFTGISDTELMVSSVIHKAFIEVNEEGTEAAAATAITMIPLAAALQEKKIFRADHPFLFVIQCNKTGLILFMGKVENPTK